MKGNHKCNYLHFEVELFVSERRKTYQSQYKETIELEQSELRIYCQPSANEENGGKMSTTTSEPVSALIG